MFMDMGAFNDPDVVLLLWAVGVCDANGRLGYEDEDTSDLMKIRHIFNAVKSVKFADAFPNGETNVARIKDGMFKARVHAVKAA